MKKYRWTFGNGIVWDLEVDADGWVMIHESTGGFLAKKKNMGLARSYATTYLRYKILKEEEL